MRRTAHQPGKLETNRSRGQDTSMNSHRGPSGWWLAKPELTFEGTAKKAEFKQEVYRIRKVDNNKC